MTVTTGSARADWLYLAVEFLGTGVLAAVALLAAIVPERMQAAGIVSPILIATWVSTAILILSVASGGRATFRFNPLFTFLAVASEKLDLKPSVFVTSAQVAGAFAGTVIAQFGLNLDPVQAADPSYMNVHWILAEGLASFILGILSQLLVTGPMPGLLARLAAASLLSGFYFIFIAFAPGIVFGNPAMTLARTLTTNALEISPLQAFIAMLANLAGAGAAYICFPSRTIRPFTEP